MTRALLDGTAGQIASINSSHSRIQAGAAATGNAVLHCDYKAIIDAAQANTDRIAAQLAATGRSCGS